ncbi:hypothetical protein G6F31_018272 [Rhizopus arrhizus]|nr:hypothetical protein G6F31_018272 [Rhizopus arrhizus]
MPGNLEVVVATGGGDRQHVMQGQAQFAGDGVVAAMAVAGHRGGTEYRAVGQAYIRRVVQAFTAALDNRSEAGVRLRLVVKPVKLWKAPSGSFE